MIKAVFLDRDGTMIKDKNYLDTPEGVEWFSGTFEALRELRQAGYKLIMITNQSGVARGYMTEDDVEAIHDRITDDLAEEGLNLNGIYYCPYLKDGDVPEYTKDSPLRKPAPGMLHQAEEELDVDLGSSYVIGDKTSDVQAGNRAGCHTILVRTGKGRDSERSLPEKPVAPDIVVDGLPDAADWILEHDAGGGA